MKLNDWVRVHDPVGIAAGISCVNTVIAFVPWFIMQPATFAALPWSPTLVSVYFIYAYFIVGFATTANVFAQRRASAAQATIIYATEIVFSMIWAVFLPASIVDPVEPTWQIIVGCAFVVAGNLIEVIPTRKDRETVEKGFSEEKPIAEIPVAAAVSSTTRKVKELLGPPVVRKLATFAILLGVYIAIALPFKVLSVIPGFTDIRPVSFLMPIYGIFFGVPGCLAFAVGNLIGDIMSDSLRWSSIAGLVGNFAGPYVMYLFWCRLRKKDFDLRSGKALTLMVGIIVVSALAQLIIIAPAVAAFYPDVDIALFTLSVLGNGIVFPLGLSIPIIVLMQEELGFKPLVAGKHHESRPELPER